MQRPARSDDPSSPPARRISVVGPSGSGKSVLSRALAGRLALPHVVLDSIRQAQPDDAEFVRRVAALTAGPAWIIDGHYRLVRESIWQRSDIIVWLNYPLGFVLLRLVRRFAAKRGSARNAGGRVGEGRPASWSRRLGRLARTLRERGEYRALLAVAERRGTVVVELRSEKDSRLWLDSLAGETASKDHHADR